MNINLSQIQTANIYRTIHITVDLPAHPIRYYRHGWQSWSLTAWTDTSPLPIQKPYLFHAYQTDAVYARELNPHGSWLGAVEFEDGKVLLLGALTIDTHVFLLPDQLKGQSEAAGAEWFIAYGSEDEVFDAYVRELGSRFGVAEKTHVPRVWCSWYSFYSNINEINLHETFDQLGDLPFDVLQVDDGWQRDIGDWEPNENFPSGMRALADKIKTTGRTAGLWLAPFIVSRSSKLFHEHPEWLLRDEKGKLVSAGFNYWGRSLYAMDVTHPDAISWLVRLMEQVRSWGFDYYKLDFLYAGAMQGKRHINMPREAAFRNALGRLREAMGKGAFFLTCGTPILPSLGMCNAIRIGPDVSHQWENDLYERLLQNFDGPGTKNAIRTVLHRLWLKPLVHIDPDVEYFVARENQLKEEHKSQLRDLALICDFKATSDLPQWMTPEERKQVCEFLEADPKVTKLSRYVYKLDERIVDFSSVVELTPQAGGLARLYGEFMGWAGNFKPMIWLFLAIDNMAKKKRILKIKD